MWLCKGTAVSDVSISYFRTFSYSRISPSLSAPIKLETQSSILVSIFCRRASNPNFQVMDFFRRSMRVLMLDQFEIALLMCSPRQVLVGGIVLIIGLSAPQKNIFRNRLIRIVDFSNHSEDKFA